jgi:hypothetical protein
MENDSLLTPGGVFMEPPVETIPPENPTPSLSQVRIWNLLTFFLLFGIIGQLVIFMAIYTRPDVSFNPFPPAPLPAAVVIPTATPTPIYFPPTWTTTPQPSATPTITPTPGERTPTSLPVYMTLEGIIQTPTIGPTALPGEYAFSVQPGSPAAVSSSIMRPELNCSWMGLGGQAVDLQGAPITGLRVQLYGFLKGQAREVTSLTGTVKRYGEAGYEFTLADKPVQSYNTMWVQLLDQAGMALSDKVYFETFDSCDKNLIIINFKQVR